jgi:hypothetical protein
MLYHIQRRIVLRPAIRHFVDLHIGIMMSRNALLAIFCIASLSIVGCSGGAKSDRKPVFKVTGKVMMSGGPVANAMVTFSPKQKQPVAIGRTDNNGQFTLTTYDAGDGAAEGEYVALVSKSTATAPVAPTAHDPSKPAFDSRSAHGQQASGQAAEVGLPEKYSRINQSDLIAKVEKSGKNDFNFELKP